MILYFDTSCLAKIYINEAGSDSMKEAIAKAEIVTTSLLAYPEMRSALARRKREGVFSEAAYRQIIKIFKQDWNEVSKIALSEAIIEDAGRLAEIHHLRALDAIHLASALFLRKQSGEPVVVFLSSDDKLNAAAKKEKLLCFVNLIH